MIFLACLCMFVGVAQSQMISTASLHPSKRQKCPYKCNRYFAGASARSAVVCQKQASGVGTFEQNDVKGVTCFPPYGCGEDMITCLNPELGGTRLPNTGDPDIVAHACNEIASLTAENPWQCVANNNCQHDSPTKTGGWLKATASLGCGWGSTYGNIGPGNEVSATPATHIYQDVQDVTECCKLAMGFDMATWDEGGAAIFFQYGLNLYGHSGKYCRVDREQLIYGNLDSSSGRSIRYQTTRCGAGDFYYRHAAGAADAANLHSGGRCVVRGRFKRLNLVSGEAILPRGELPYGQELPNHACGNIANCGTTLMFNTINDAEDCCEMCTSLKWFAPNDPNVGGDASRDQEAGLHRNPCVAWQIVQGRCRIVRKAYFDAWNPGQTIQSALLDDDYRAPGNTNWVIASRGCGTNPEWCNYYSFIHYRELGTPANTTSENSTHRQLATGSTASGWVNFSFSATANPNRRDGRLRLLNQSSTQNFDKEGPDCGTIELFNSTAVYEVDGMTVFDESQSLAPLCKSPCVSAGENTTFACDLSSNDTRHRLTVGRNERRLQGGGGYVLSFTGVGSGYNNVDFTATLENSTDESSSNRTQGGRCALVSTKKADRLRAHGFRPVRCNHSNP